MRSFPSYQGQRNFPGWYWSSKMGRYKPGTLLRQAAYLHQRTGGMIGSLDQPIHEAAPPPRTGK